MKRFDVVCAGQTLWSTADGLEPSAAILEVVEKLARRGLRVALATVLDDDRRSRRALAKLAALGVDVAGATLAPASSRLVVVDGAGGQSEVLADADPVRELVVPPSSASVLLLHGCSPVTSAIAALCRAARRARRAGTVVALDLSANLRQWAGRDPRTLAMLLREVDVVHASLMDIAVIGTDAATLRAAVRPGATIVLHALDATTALGPFGEVRAPSDPTMHRDGTRCVAAICLELARPPRTDETHSGRWHRVVSVA